MRRLVFVDSCEFIAANFHFEGGRLGALLALIADGKIVLGLPSVTRQELFAHIAKQMAIAQDRLRTTRKELRLLRAVDDVLPLALFGEFDTTAWSNGLIAKLTQTLDEAQVIDLAFDGLDVAHVFELYFSSKAPFANSDKKSEFPDAFALAMVSAWGVREKDTVLIASSDQDVIDGAAEFPQLEYAGDLAQLLERITTDLDSRLAIQANRRFDQLQGAIEADIKERFSALGFFLEDQNGDVNEVTVDKIELDAVLVLLTHDEATVRAVFDARVIVTFTANITYDDNDTAIYDHEEGVYVALHQIEDEIEQEDEFDLSLEITFPAKGSSAGTFQLLDWSNSRDVGVTAVVDENLD